MQAPQAPATQQVTTYPTVAAVMAELFKYHGEIDGMTIVYPHQISDGCTVTFKHKNFDVVIATARLWFRNKVEYSNGIPVVQAVFGELSFGQNTTNVTVSPAGPSVPTPSPASSAVAVPTVEETN